jgi:hypothetical protein
VGAYEQEARHRVPPRTLLHTCGASNLGYHPGKYREGKKVCERNGGKLVRTPTISRGVVDEKSLRGGLMVFAKEDQH